ncbi:MAG: hypothetical protein ACRDHZ_20390 [Ktedonobacteraceae bacterium]
MGFLTLLAANFWISIVLMIFIITIVSIVLGIALEAYKVKMKFSQKMLELRNEELRLRLKMEQQNKEKRTGVPMADFISPKEASWEEQAQTSYEMGYQQQRL